MKNTTPFDRHPTWTRFAISLAAVALPHAGHAAASVGLSTLHSRLLSNPTVAEWLPQTDDNFADVFATVPIPWANGDQFGWSLATGDFDGDRHDDLVVGTPFGDATGVGSDDGSAALLYGSLFADGFEWDGSLLFWSEVVP